MRTFLFLFAFLATQFCDAQIFYVRFPDDTLIVNYCNVTDPSTTGQPVFYNPDSLPLVAEFYDEVFGITPVCFTITRNWTVYNAATYDPAGSLIYVPNPAALSFSNFTTNMQGPVVSPVHAPGDPWSATIQKIYPTDTVPTDFSMFWDSLANGYGYKQLIHVLDTLPPTILSCASDTLHFVDTTGNDTLFWRESYWSEPGLPWHDLRECPVDLSVVAVDSCSGTSLGADFLLFLDLDQDGIQETVVHSANNFPPGTVKFNNINTPNYSGGTVQTFDERPVPAADKFVFDEEHTVVNNQVIFTMRWRKYSWPYTYVTPQLPPGKHKIRWSVYDGCGQESTCEYVFTVTGGLLPPGGFKNVYVHFPDDVYTNNCDGNFNFGAPDIFNPDSADIQLSFENEEIDPVPDACYIIQRGWTIWNADSFDPMLPCTEVPNPTPNAIATHPDNLPGPVISPEGALPPWEPTVSKISPGAPDPTHFSAYWSEYANCYHYVQSIKILDIEPPVALNCSLLSTTITDSSANDPQLWNASYWLDPASGSSDLKEGEVDLNLSATDSCAGSSLTITCLLFLDLDQDGTMESVISSQNPPPPGMLRFNNYNTPNFLGGELRQFDQRGLPAEESYQFTLQNTVDGDHKTAAIRWNTQSALNTYTLPQLPPGTHKIKWIIGDDCGNQTLCEHLFVVVSPLSGVNNAAENAGIRLYPPEPNPFEDQTTIRFRLPASGSAQFTVLDATGRRLWEKMEDLPAGEHSLILKKDQLGGASGLFICRLEYNGQVLAQKMVLK